MVRGLRWLGNSRVVSFSYSQVWFRILFSLNKCHSFHPSPGAACFSFYSLFFFPLFFDFWIGIFSYIFFKHFHVHYYTLCLRVLAHLLIQANEKSGGYINRLVVTCVRSGLNKMFRVLQKPERAPIRALRASSSGRLTFN